MNKKVTLLCSSLFLVFVIGGVASISIEGLKLIGQISCIGLIIIMVILVIKSYMDKRKYKEKYEN